eukprot:jgi/Mesvir1/24859/Mv22093-RA.1
MGEAGVSTDRYPLFLACGTGRLDMVALLVAHGASLTTVPDSGLNIVQDAARHGHLNIARYLVEQGADPHYVTKSGRTALHLAAYSGDQRLVEYLVDLGVSVRAKDKSLFPLLWGGGDPPWVVQLLTSPGPMCNLVGVNYLAACGLNVHEKDKDGETPLHLAAYSGNLELVQWLIQRGLDLLARDKLGRTALYLAAATGNKALVTYLAVTGLSIHTKDKWGNDAAVYSRDKAVATFLKTHIQEAPAPKKRVRSR